MKRSVYTLFRKYADVSQARAVAESSVVKRALIDAEDEVAQAIDDREELEVAVGALTRQGVSGAHLGLIDLQRRTREAAIANRRAELRSVRAELEAAHAELEVARRLSKRAERIGDRMTASRRRDGRRRETRDLDEVGGRLSRR